jgi:ribosomal protein S20
MVELESLKEELRQAQDHCENLQSQIRQATPIKRKNDSISSNSGLLIKKLNSVITTEPESSARSFLSNFTLPINNLKDFQIQSNNEVTRIYSKLKLKPQPERYTYLFAALAEIVDFAR